MALSPTVEMQQDMIMLQSSSMKPQKKSKPPPLVLCNTEAQYWPLLSPLAEFAAIATSPESPLVKEMSYENGTVSNAFKLPSIEHVTPSSDTRDFSSCSEATPSLSWTTSSLWERLDANMCDEQCGTNDDSYSGACYTSAPYQTHPREERQTAKTSSLFRPYNMKDVESGASNVEETPAFNHTPWSKYYKTENSGCLGLPCRELLLGDVCIPLSSSEKTALQNEDVTTTSDLKPSVLFDLDSAAQALSNMAKRKEEHVEYQRKLETTLQVVKRKGTRVRKRKNANSCARRPMNAFMLFAKRYRVEITRKHPGKDNRAISVILGDEWKSLSSEDRKVYITEAKTLAEEHKRIYPDCWKRKRTTQVSSRTNRKH